MIINHLATHGVPQTMAAISDALGIARSTVCSLLNELVDEGSIAVDFVTCEGVRKRIYRLPTSDEVEKSAKESPAGPVGDAPADARGEEQPTDRAAAPLEPSYPPPFAGFYRCHDELKNYKIYTMTTSSDGLSDELLVLKLLERLEPIARRRVLAYIASRWSREGEEIGSEPVLIRE